MGYGLRKRKTGSSIPAGQIAISSTQSVTLPIGVHRVQVCLVGGGGGGGMGRYFQSSGGYWKNSGGSGGGGGRVVTIWVSVPTRYVTAEIGAGGSPGTKSGFWHDGDDGDSYSTYTPGGAGGATMLWDEYGNMLARAAGGDGGASAGGTGDTARKFGVGGGSGSGSGGASEAYNIDGTAGGSDGGNGAAPNGGTGQGYSTRAFGEAGGTLFAGAGGGGGGDYESNDGVFFGTGGAGGAGGGGNGGDRSSWPTAGTDGTGGGGGGANGRNTGARGGSGYMIIRWRQGGQ